MYTVNEHASPFDELDDDQYPKRFHQTQATTLLLLSEMKFCHSTINDNIE